MAITVPDKGSCQCFKIKKAAQEQPFLFWVLEFFKM